ncbi:formate-dependent nitrite reductase complex subunit NrfF [Gallibacterium anatis UMN179]|uniref:Cytochrome c-type biogenesis protein n=1 Tax=Gallibacterium anatis (strain UMN179) TaxID=1005058 RepID=F4HCS0_GALAU|nr:formate-dependent nitrite reductase complex subunit NrfF [Gallibacterium anatis UMN179]
MFSQIKKIMFVLLLSFGYVVAANAAIEALHFSSTEQEQTYHQLTQELRCPQCQNNNIADSNALVATDMRGKVFELLQQGKSKQEIIDYMVARYGNFVTYDPPLTAATLVLWLVPLFLLVVGVIIFWRKRHSLADNAIEEDLDDAQQQRLQQLLKKDKA